MQIDRLLYSQPFTKDAIPLWRCPTCSRGILKGEETEFVITETVTSKQQQADPDWDPTWINGAFTGILRCTNNQCQEIILVTGKMRVVEKKQYNDKDGIWQFEQVEQLYPLIFKPTLVLFEIEEHIPENIQKALENAFSLFWLDEASCANKIRGVVELIMDERKVAKTYIQGGKRRLYSLHKRIELFQAVNSEVSECLMAVKWIGNSGSHASDILVREDIFDGLDVLRYVLYKLYEKDTQRIKRLTRKINKLKGPTKKKNT